MNKAFGDQIRQGWAFLQSQRPLAAWASWQVVVRQHPDHKAAVEALQRLEQSYDLPEVARKQLRFLPPDTDARRLRWNDRLNGQADSPAMAEPANAALIFQELLEDDPHDAPAAWNIAICLAWAGANRAAVNALDQFIQLSADSDTDRCADAWSLAELLRHGAGAEEIADCVTDAIQFRLTDDAWCDPPEFLQSYAPFQQHATPGELPGSEVQSVMLVDLLRNELTESSSPVSILASAVVKGDIIRLSQPSGSADSDFLNQVEGHLLLLENFADLEWSQSVLPLTMLDSAVARFSIDRRLPEQRRDALSKMAVADYFEQTWIHHPRHGLGGMTPLNAARIASAEMKVKIEGLIQFQEQMARRPTSRPLYQDYDFDRLRYRLGLIQPPGSIDAKGDARHKSLMWFHISEVKKHDPDTIPETYLATAWETAFAYREDALAVKLADALARREPARLAEIPLTRWVAPFLRQALAEGDAELGMNVIQRALELDRQWRAGTESRYLLKWRAELTTRLEGGNLAVEAWVEACTTAGSRPIDQFEAVQDLLQVNSAWAVEFLFRDKPTEDSEYVDGLNARLMQHFHEE